jgi:hypothetical protein
VMVQLAAALPFAFGNTEITVVGVRDADRKVSSFVDHFVIPLEVTATVCSVEGDCVRVSVLKYCVVAAGAGSAQIVGIAICVYRVVEIDDIGVLIRDREPYWTAARARVTSVVSPCWRVVKAILGSPVEELTTAKVGSFEISPGRGRSATWLANEFSKKLKSNDRC